MGVIRLCGVDPRGHRSGLMLMGIACPRCKSEKIRATRKPYKVLTPRLSIRLWQCECGERFMIANVLVKDTTADKLEEIYDAQSTEGIH
jgi:hypothetical protein